MIKKSFIVLVGGHPKGYDEPFHLKTKSGKILRKITDDLNIQPVFFDLWTDQKDEDSRKLKSSVKKHLYQFIKNNYKIIALGRYIEKALLDNGYACTYLPHPASRDIKYINVLKKGLTRYN